MPDTANLDRSHVRYLAWLAMLDAERDAALANRHNADPWTTRPLNARAAAARAEYERLVAIPE